MSEESRSRQTPAASEAEMEEHFRNLLSPFGDDVHRRERERAVRFLLEHADHAHPRLLDALRANPNALDAPAIIEVLPLFGKEESVCVLEQIMLRGDEHVGRVAGIAIGRHPSSSALEVLLHGLESHLNETIIAAADGLLVRGDRSACAALRKLMQHADDIVRYHVIQAVEKLGCPGSDEK